MEARFKGFSGGVGSGKSTALCHEAFYRATENAGRAGLLGAPTYAMLRDATMASFLEICAASDAPYELNRAEMTVDLKECGSKVLFRSMDSPERLRGSNLAWFGVDELTYCDEDAWTRLEARLRDPKATRLCGFGVWTPKGFDWVYRRFRGEPIDGYGLVEAEPLENRRLLAVTPDYYERLKASYDPLFYEQEALGRYIVLSGERVYYEFDREESSRPGAVDAREPLLWSLDFNVNPMCSVVAQRAGEGLHVIDEIRLRSSSTPEACEEFERRYGEHPAGVRIFGDASGHQRRSAGGYSDFQVMRERFARSRTKTTFVTARSNPPVQDRINLVNARLKGADGVRRLFIDPRCRELLRDLEEVSYKADSRVVDKERDPARTHMADALGYLVWQEFQKSPQPGERGRRLL